MRLSTIIMIVAALTVSGLTSLLIQRYLVSRAPSVESTEEIIPAERVLVAKSDLPGGTVLKAKDHFRWQVWPAQGLNKEHVLKGSSVDKELIGAVVRREIKRGSPITANLVYRTGEKGFLASGLKPGMLGVAVKVDPEIGVAGLVTPGDYVDVILTTTVSVDWEIEDKKVPRVKESRKISETILRNVRVLAVNQNADKQGKVTKKPKSATLEVTGKQAEILANARRMGKMYLALRSHVPSEVARPERNYEFTSDLEILSSLRGGLVSHIVEQNFRAIDEFDLKRWVEVPDGSGESRPRVAVQPVQPADTKPRIKIQAPTLKPSSSSSAGRKPLVASADDGEKPEAKKPAPIKAEPKAAIEQPALVAKKPVATATPTPAPAPTPALTPVVPAEPKTVRVDRAGRIQTLKFKEAQ